MSSPATPEAVADRLHSAAIHLLRQLRREDEAAGLSAARLSALSVVVFAGPLSVGALARAEQVRSPTMSRIVAGLEADGLVRRQASTRDARAVVISATAKGTRILHKGRERRVANLGRRLGELEADDLELLAAAAEVLERVVAPER